MLAYGEMNVFKDHSKDLAIQLWIVARYVESISLLAAVALVGKRIQPMLIFGVYAAVVASSLIAAGVKERVLVVGADQLHWVMDYWDRDTCVLFGDGDIVVALGKALGKLHHAGALAHGGRDTDEPLVRLGHVAEPLTENVLVFGPGLAQRGRKWVGGLWPLGGLRIGLGLDLVDRVIPDRVLFCRQEALAFHGADMQKLRPFEVLHIFQGVNQLRQVVAVQRPDIVEAQLLEQGAGSDHTLHMLLGALGPLP